MPRKIHTLISIKFGTYFLFRFVEKTIEQTISEHIFGGWDFNQNAGSQGNCFFNFKRVITESTHILF